MTSCGEFLGIYVATIRIVMSNMLRIYVATIGTVMSNMLSIYVATAGIVMSNMLINCVGVCTSIDKPIYSVLQTEVHSSFLPLIISLTWHGQVVYSVFSAPLGCY